MSEVEGGLTVEERKSLAVEFGLIRDRLARLEAGRGESISQEPAGAYEVVTFKVRPGTWARLRDRQRGGGYGSVDEVLRDLLDRALTSRVR